ncbi:MAG: creatininase family protein [Verrucomicrobiales bacterium]|nr:creatininase family protein [Verrucomicrobiales bacterium]
MSAPVLIEFLPWPEIAELRDEGAGMLLLPLGATEQHGPHLPVNTDTVIATRVCEYASSVTGTPLLPPLSYTVSSGHTAKWPGTFSLTHEALIETVGSIAEWAAKTGWSKLLLVNSHFGNDASLRVAVEKIRLEFPGSLQIGLKHTFQLSQSIWDYFISDAEDLHANRAETDLLLHLAPETVRMEAVEDDPDRTAGTVFSYPVAQTSLNGVTGSPSLGNAERGARLFTEMGNALAELIESASSEQPPLEPSHWDCLLKNTTRTNL